MRNKLPEPPERLKLQLYTNVYKSREDKDKEKNKEKDKKEDKNKEKKEDKDKEKDNYLPAISCRQFLSLFSLFKYLSVIKEILCFTFYTSLILIRKNLSKICRNKLFPL